VGERTFPSLTTIVVPVVVVGMSIAGWGVLQHGFERQDQVLLQNDTNQVALVFQVAFDEAQSDMTGLVTSTVASGESERIFDQQAEALISQPSESVALVGTSDGVADVLLATGPGLHQGEQLSGLLAEAVSGAGPQLSSSPVVQVGSGRFVLLTASSPVESSHYVALVMSPVHPQTPAANESGPYAQIDVALYATLDHRSDELIGSSLALRPLPHPTVTSIMKVGSVRWLFEGAAKAPLAGAPAEAAPWILLGVGCALAVALAVAFEITVRRRRTADRLVAERTAELLLAQEDLVKKERLSALGEMATTIGHELRNPLGAVVNALYLARRRLAGHEDAELTRHLDLAERETNRAATLSEDLTTYMRQRTPQIRHLSLAPLVEQVLGATELPEGVDVEIREPLADVDADEHQLVQILTNVLTNAYQAMPDGGSLLITSARDDGFVDITVRDNGVGIDEPHLGRLFEPFFTTKPTGTGLGLAIVKRLAEGHGGTASVESPLDGGASVIVRFPVAKSDDH